MEDFDLSSMLAAGKLTVLFKHYRTLVFLVHYVTCDIEALRLNKVVHPKDTTKIVIQANDLRFRVTL